MLGEFENGALFLRLGLPSTLIRIEKLGFSNMLLKPEEFKNAGFEVLVWTEIIFKMEIFQ